VTIFVVGHIGTDELGAVSLATMTANITGLAVYEGLATSKKNRKRNVIVC